MLPEQSERGYHRTWEKTTQPLCTPSLWVKSFIVRWYWIVIIKIKKTGAPAFFPHTRLKDQKLLLLPIMLCYEKRRLVKKTNKVIDTILIVSFFVLKDKVLQNLWVPCLFRFHRHSKFLIKWNILYAILCTF